MSTFFQLTTSEFCGTCHNVNLVNGVRLEEAFSEFKNNPVAKKGISCQDCHMGKEPGRVMAERDDPNFEKKNYDFGPAAVVSNIETAPQKLTSQGTYTAVIQLKAVMIPVNLLKEIRGVSFDYNMSPVTWQKYCSWLCRRERRGNHLE